MPVLRRFLWPLLIALTASVAVAALTLGAPVPLADLWGADAERAETARLIFVENRLHRVLAGLLVGAALSVAGASLQTIFRNPLAEPYLLGISAGGALGATVAAAMRLPSVGVFESSSVLAFVGAMGSAAAIYRLGQSRVSVAMSYGDDKGRLLLTGVAMSAFLSALMSLTITLSGRIELIQQASFWLLGGLTRTSTQQNLVLFLALAGGSVLLISGARDLNALRAGEEDAAALGVDLRSLHFRVLVASSLLSAAAVATAGLIGFVGLLAPHVVRMAGARDIRALLPGAALFGGALLCGCDALARSAVPPQEIPVGIITSLLGVPLFLSLARKS